MMILEQQSLDSEFMRDFFWILKNTKGGNQVKENLDNLEICKPKMCKNKRLQTQIYYRQSNDREFRGEENEEEV